MQSEVIETVAKYFFFTALDERVSFSASLRVLAELKSKNWLNPKYRDRWIETLAKAKPRLRGVFPKSWSDNSADRAFQMKGTLDLSVWASFQSTTDPEEVEAVLFSKVLGFTDEEIASGLSVTVGTVRYRIGRGLRRLGGYVEN
jgi:DNA-directed RNA polymerase specialized sigma24 family protein